MIKSALTDTKFHEISENMKYKAYKFESSL